MKIELRQSTLTLIVGERGYGKSLYAYNLAKRYGRFIYLDKANTFGKRGLTPVVSEYDRAKALIDAVLQRQARRLVLYATVEVYEDVFAGLRPLIDRQVPLKLALVVDECQNYMTTKTINPDLSRIIAEGRHCDLDVIFVARQFREVNIRARSQCDRVISFRQQEALDLKYVKEYNRNGLHFENYVANLGRDEFVKIRG